MAAHTSEGMLKQREGRVPEAVKQCGACSLGSSLSVLAGLPAGLGGPGKALRGTWKAPVLGRGDCCESTYSDLQKPQQGSLAVIWWFEVEDSGHRVRGMV